MFKNSISYTMLTSDAANLFFSNISGEAFGADSTFLATLRALVAPRLPENESIYLSFGRSTYNAKQISETPAKRIIELLCERMSLGNGNIYVHNLNSRGDADIAANIEVLKSHFCNVYDGWQILSKISTFYQKSFSVVCFINPTTKSVSLFVDNLNLQKLHYLQMSTLAFLPWYFDAKQGVEEIEMEMLKSLRERSSAKWESCIAEISKRYDFESGRIKHLLSDFEVKYEKIERNRVQAEIDQINRTLLDIDRRFAEQLKKKNDLCIRLLGLEQRLADDTPSELMEYFLCNRKLYLEDVSENSMCFSVRDYLSYFDEDAAQTYINNKRSRLYDGCSGYLTEERMEKLLTAIFIDQTLRVRFCAAYYFSLNGSVGAQYHHRFNAEFDGYKPNPHIDEYECMGNYKRTINEALLRRDYITALEQCMASAKSLNLHDITVVGTFIRQLTEYDGSAYRAIELPDGSIVTTKEAIEWIEAQEDTAEPASEAPIVESAERMPEVPDDVAERAAEAAAAPVPHAEPEPDLPF